VCKYWNCVTAPSALAMGARMKAAPRMDTPNVFASPWQILLPLSCTKFFATFFMTDYSGVQLFCGTRTDYDESRLNVKIRKKLFCIFFLNVLQKDVFAAEAGKKSSQHIEFQLVTPHSTPSWNLSGLICKTSAFQGSL